MTPGWRTRSGLSVPVPRLPAMTDFPALADFPALTGYPALAQQFRVDQQGRPDPPFAADETVTLLGFLEFQRATFAWKTGGLDAAGLTTKVAASSMTLGGMFKHLSYVEDWWFSGCLHDRDPAPDLRRDELDADRDWDWESAAADSPERLRSLWQRTVARSRSAVAEALAGGDLGQLSKYAFKDGSSPSLRWIVVHMIEEYSRHNGHADLIREAIDGSTGE